MEETIDTGVIYKITNKNTDKFYIGKAFSFTHRRDRNTQYKHGAFGRFKRHWRNASSLDIQKNNQCPIFYEALRDSEKTDWEIKVLKICEKDKLKKYEKKYIKKLNSHDPEIGYNYFVADNKPICEQVKQEFSKRKAEANRNRAKDGKLKRNNDGLPANIYKRTSNLPNGDTIHGYFVQIKINDKLMNRAFMSKKDSEEVKLEKAKTWLHQIKNEL